jgi:hypothetical protein
MAIHMGFGQTAKGQNYFIFRHNIQISLFAEIMIFAKTIKGWLNQRKRK